jgi:hypothetical protein
VDVGPFVVADAEASELIEPGKRPLHDPAPPTEATPVRRAALRDKRENPTGSQSVADRRLVVAAIPEHTVWPLPRSATFAVQRGTGIDQRHGFLRVVPICAGQTHGERHASAVANQMALAPALGPIGGIRTSLVTAMHCPDGTTVHDRPGPINLIVAREPIQQRKVDPNTRVPAGASARERRCGGRRRCPVRHARSETRCRPVAVVVESARAVRRDPTTHLEAAQRRYAFTLPRRGGSGFGGFVTRSKP